MFLPLIPFLASRLYWPPYCAKISRMLFSQETAASAFRCLYILLCYLSTAVINQSHPDFVTGNLSVLCLDKIESVATPECLDKAHKVTGRFVIFTSSYTANIIHLICNLCQQESPKRYLLPLLWDMWPLHFQSANNYGSNMCRLHNIQIAELNRSFSQDSRGKIQWGSCWTDSCFRKFFIMLFNIDNIRFYIELMVKHTMAFSNAL